MYVEPFCWKPQKHQDLDQSQMAGLPFCNSVFLIRTFVLICSVCPRFALYMWHVGVYYYYHLVSFLSLDRIDIGYFLLRNMPL